jgi:hypothetical protein
MQLRLVVCWRRSRLGEEFKDALTTQLLDDDDGDDDDDDNNQNSNPKQNNPRISENRK